LATEYMPLGHKEKKMRRILLLAVLSALVLAAMPSLASAQRRAGSGFGGGGYGGYNRPYTGGYGYYDPAYLQQMINLPDGLATCTVDFSTVRVTACRPVIKEVGAIRAHLQNPDGGLLGTVHVEKGRLHFRPFDDTNRRLGPGSAGALGAGAGAMVGYGSTRNMRNRGAANAIGAGATIGSALIAGFMASRHSHNNCMVVEPSVAQSGGLAVSTAGANVSHPEQESRSAMTDKEEGRFELYNSTRVYVDAYDGTTFMRRLDPGERMSVGQPKSRYRGISIVPQEDGRLAEAELSIKAESTGWIFTEMATRPPAQ
jgi:hypothetical protein